MNEVRATASDALPALGGFLSAVTYKTCYLVSYGLVFPTVLVVRAIPKENPVVHGLVDGACAAIDLVDQMQSGLSPGNFAAPRRSTTASARDFRLLLSRLDWASPMSCTDLVSCTDLAVSFPTRGVIRLSSRALFGDADSPTCRHFIDRALQVQEIADVTIAMGESPHAELRYCPKTFTLQAVVNELTSILRESPKSTDTPGRRDMAC